MKRGGGGWEGVGERACERDEERRRVWGRGEGGAGRKGAPVGRRFGCGVLGEGARQVEEEELGAGAPPQSSQGSAGSCAWGWGEVGIGAAKLEVKPQPG